MEAKKDKIKIAFIEQTALLGGAQVNECYLQKYLDRSRFESVVICPCEGPLTEELRNLGAAVLLMPMPKFYSTSTRIGNFQFFNPLAVLLDVIFFIPIIINLRSFLKSQKCDLAVTNGMLAHFYGGIAARLAGIPSVWLLADIIKPNLAFGFVKWVFRKTASLLPRKVVVVSHAVQAQMILDSEKVEVIHNAANLEKYDPGLVTPHLRKEYKIPDDAKIVGVLSRLTPWKGQREFLRGASQVVKVFPSARFFVVGGALFDSDVYLQELRELTRKSNLEKHVIFAGFRRNIPECIASLDICVLPSVLPDPCPLVLFESMAMKKPVIATNHGGAPEIVVDGETGILVPPGDVDKLAEAMLDLIRNPAKARAMGEKGRQRVEDHFSMEEFIHKHSDVFEETYREGALRHGE